MKTPLIIGSAALALSLAQPSFAAPVVDQQCLCAYSITTINPDPNGGPGLAQSFTAGRAGKLTSIELQLGWYGSQGPDDIEITVVPLDSSGAPKVGEALGSGTIVGSSITVYDAFYAVDLSSANIFVGIGDQLAFTVLGGPGNGTEWRGDHIRDRYVGGHRWVYNSSAGELVERVGDFSFRTLVDESETPQLPVPGMVWLLGLGGVVAAGRLRLRSR